MNKVKRLIISLGLSGILSVAVSSVVFAADAENLDSLPNCSVSIETGQKVGDLVSVFRNDTEELLYTLNMTSDTVYSTVYLNVRVHPTTESKVVKVVAPGYEFKRVAHSDFGWDLVLVNGDYCFVWNKYLSDEKLTVKEVSQETCSSLYSAAQFQNLGVINWNGYRWTWYSQKILPGYGLDIPGRYVDANGYVCDENNYICLASNDLPKGTIVSTPFGKSGKVYDCGCASGTLDVYVNW